MNEKQKEWTNRHCNELKAYLDQHPISDSSNAEAVSGYINVIVALSKENREVRAVLFDVIEPFQKRAEEEMRWKKKNE